MLSIKKGLFAKYPILKKLYPLGDILGWIVAKIVHQDECNKVLQTYDTLSPFDFNQKVLELFYVNFTSFKTEKIPTTGRVLIYANHPLGALEALALIEVVRSVRQDIKIVANELLMYIKPLNPLFLPVDALTAKTSKESIANIIKALKNDEAVIIFPAGEVSRKTKEGIRDGEWNRGFLRFASKTKTPLLPIKIEATNSWYFYLISKIYKPFSTLLLPDQMFRRKGKKMEIKVGELLTAETYANTDLNEEEQVAKLKEQLYQL